ncbi:MAG: BRO family protein [Chitinophagaceae bacterium]
MGTIVPTLSVDTAGGKQKMGCATSQGLLRIIQSIPSPKAEPFKLWLAQVGSDRLDEIENPELATQRNQRTVYNRKAIRKTGLKSGRSSVAIGKNLPDEWKTRGVKEQKEYASTVTAEISKATFGVRLPAQYKKCE